MAWLGWLGHSELHCQQGQTHGAQQTLGNENQLELLSSRKYSLTLRNLMTRFYMSKSALAKIAPPVLQR